MGSDLISVTCREIHCTASCRISTVIRSLNSVRDSSLSCAQNVFETLVLLFEMRSYWFCQVSLEENRYHIECHFETCVFSSIKIQMHKL